MEWCKLITQYLSDSCKIETEVALKLAYPRPLVLVKSIHIWIVIPMNAVLKVTVWTGP